MNISKEALYKAAEQTLKWTKDCGSCKKAFFHRNEEPSLFNALKKIIVSNSYLETSYDTIQISHYEMEKG